MASCWQHHTNSLRSGLILQLALMKCEMHARKFCRPHYYRSYFQIWEWKVHGVFADGHRSCKCGWQKLENVSREGRPHVRYFWFAEKIIPVLKVAKTARKFFFRLRMSQKSKMARKHAKVRRREKTLFFEIQFQTFVSPRSRTQSILNARPWR